MTAYTLDELLEWSPGSLRDRAWATVVALEGAQALIDEVVQALGCHPAMVMAELAQVIERAERVPTADDYRQARDAALEEAALTAYDQFTQGGKYTMADMGPGFAATINAIRALKST